MDRYLKEQESAFKERYDRTHSIICPYCNDKQDEEAETAHTSSHGEKKDEEKVQYCQECGKEFIVEESVDRTFETTKKED